MGLSPLYSSDGSPLTDADGNQLYVEVLSPDPTRTVKIPAENRVVKIPAENRTVKVGKG